jgi:phospho-N-acetylmuramoyl-pentapeptide-transferase
MYNLFISLLTSFIITILIGKKSIQLLKNWQGKGQPIRNDGPESHMKKAGTPTMGGILIVASILFYTGIFCKITSTVIPIILVLISYSFIGFLDDYSKVKKQTTKGIKAKLRLLLEFVVAGAVIWYINPSTIINIPFVQNGLELGVLYYILASIIIVGTANSTNLTDGLDGLLSGLVIMVFTSFLVSCYMIVNKIYPEAKYGANLNSAEILNLMVLCCIVIGVFLGFLWYNANPAKIFMGDVGSLGIGGVIGTISIILKQEIYLVIIGGIFVAEALSVMIQVTSYKMRKKRVFLMAPIHHHFEKMGISENTVVMRFWIINLLLCICGILLTTF